MEGPVPIVSSPAAQELHFCTTANKFMRGMRLNYLFCKKHHNEELFFKVRCMKSYGEIKRSREITNKMMTGAETLS